MEYDIVIKNGKIIDGTGNPWFRADIGIKDGRIVKIGLVSENNAHRIINADGLVVAPGFIDIHAHDDLVFFNDPLNKPKLMQGITTVICGNCGMSPAPLSKRRVNELKTYLGIFPTNVDFDWESYGEYLHRIEELGPLGTNFAGLVGHGTLRIAVMGVEARDPEPEELEDMKKLLARSLREGAFGMSTGLIYPPGCYAKTMELIELSRVVASHGGYYATHMRNESTAVLEAIAEAIRIGREAGVRVEISHLKVLGKANWGRASEVLRMIEKARENGVDVTADAYPYTAGSTYLAALLPSWAHDGGEEKLKERCRDPRVREELRKYIEERDDWENIAKQIGWENIVLTYSPTYPEFIGKSIAEIAEMADKDPYEVVFDIIAEDGFKALMIDFIMNEGDVEKIITHPYVAVGTDGFDLGVDKPHPRTYGAFPRVLKVYVREKKILRLEDAIRKMTSLPAQKLGLRDRGLIREGCWADIVIFDPKTVSDEATYQEPRKKPKGIKYVIVNGVIEVENEELTGKRGGRVLRLNEA